MPGAWLRVAILVAAVAACGSSADDREAPSLTGEPSLAGEPWTIRSGDSSVPSPVTGAVPAAVGEFCHAPRPTAPGLEGARRLAAVSVATLNDSGVETPLRCVIRSREQWQSFRSLATPGALPDSAADFPREALLVAAMGVRGNTGYEIAMGPVTLRGDSVVVTVVSTSPLPGVQQDIIISPLQLSRIPAPRGPVLWVERGREQ